MRHAVIALLLVGACFDPPPPPGDFVESRTETFDIPEFPPPKFDLLVVVDDGPAMAPYQSHLSTFALDLVAQLRNIYGGMPNMHIAVTTAGGVPRTSPSVAGEYITDSLEFDGTRPVNYQGPLEDLLGSLVTAGSSSASTNQPLAAMKSALESTTGFFRHDAYGAVIIITAGDDASPDFGYATWLKSSYDDPTNVIVSGIYAQPSTRLDTFVHSFPNRNEVVSIDNTDWSDAYVWLGQFIRSPLSGLVCTTPPADVDPSAPGDQHDCHISWALGDHREHQMPECTTGGPRPCWQFVRNQQYCGYDEYQLFVIDGFPDPYHPAIRGECVVK